MEHINRVLRPTAEGYDILVNNELIGTITRERNPSIFAAHPSAEVPLSNVVTSSNLRDAARGLCERAEEALDDFFFEIVALPGPEMGETHFVTMAARGSGRVLEQFTTDDPYGAVEAAREVQAIPMEERWALYAEKGL